MTIRSYRVVIEVRFSFLQSSPHIEETFVSPHNSSCRQFAFRVAILVLSFCANVQAEGLKAEFDAYDYSRRLGQALNLGNALEGPTEGAWGVRLREWHFEAIADGGFESVRVPIRWSAHADETAPFEIDETFFERIDWAIENARKSDLAVIVNMHHYDEFYDDVAGHEDRFYAMWKQIAERYAALPTSTVFFELLNEPRNDLDGSNWRNVSEKAIDVIRESNPDRMLIVGSGSYNSAIEMTRLRLPEEDRNLIGTFHFYEPFQFTHQGAEWVAGAEDWLGATWDGNSSESALIDRLMNRAVSWSERWDRPVFLGEFGAYSTADMDARQRWTEYVVEAAETRDFSWSYWEFGARFGVMDRTTRQWIEPLYDALSPTSMLNLDGQNRVDLGDVELLSQKIASGSEESNFDLDGDGTINRTDLNYWIYFTENLLGDTDLDGTIAFADFLALSQHFGGNGSWSDGDFTADGTIDFEDFTILSANFGSSNSKPIGAATARSSGILSTTSVPEPDLPLGYLLAFVAFATGLSRGLGLTRVAPVNSQLQSTTTSLPTCEI